MNHAPRGGRRALDRWWLEELRRTGLRDSGVEAPKPPPELTAGVAQFNAGRFYESHETWEGLWHATGYPLRLFYLALTKLGAGLTHAQRGNATGMRRLLLDGLRFLEPFHPVFMGIDTARLDRELRGWLQRAPDASPRELPQISVAPPQ